MKSAVSVYLNPDDSDIEAVVRRPGLPGEDLDRQVREILRRVRDRGDSALIEYAATFDRVRIDRVVVSAAEIERAVRDVRPDLRMAIRHAAANIAKFHKAQRPQEETVEVEPGVRCWRRVRAIDTVGLYVPGGTAPLFSTVLMLAIPAALAGCRRVILASPPTGDGHIHPAVLYAASICGVTDVVMSGGAQAIAALAYGTESVPKADKIFGPGNQYVTRAKEIVSSAGTAVDMPAGPSEVMIAADSSADPEIIAADMISQAEHGADSQAVLLVDRLELIDPVLRALELQLRQLPRAEFARKALGSSSILLVPQWERTIDIINRYAPEHLIINRRDAELFEDRIVNAGSVFIGPWAPESAGDYASGTNHTLPTGGWARSFSGVSLDSFLKKITFQTLTPEGLKRLGPVVEVLAAAESLEGHRQAVTRRLDLLSRRGL